MIAFLLQWLVLSVAFWGTAQVLPNIEVKSFGSSIIVTAVYATLCFFVGWLLFAVFTIGTLGIAYILAFITWWIIGAMMLMLTDKLTSSFTVKNFPTALVASALIAIFNSIGHWAVGKVF